MCLGSNGANDSSNSAKGQIVKDLTPQGGAWLSVSPHRVKDG